MARLHLHRPKRTATQRQRDKKREEALLAWLRLQMGDDAVAAKYALRVIGMHYGLIGWIREAEQSFLMPAPQRRHPFDDREAGRGARVSGTRDPDDWMVGLVDRWMVVGGDPERLDSIRHRMTHKMGEMAGWYLAKTRPNHESVDPMADLIYAQRWEPLAVRLGDLIGDQVAANALATSMLGHHGLAITALTPSRGICHTARQHWSRLVAWQVRLLAEESDPHRRAPVESVGLDGERRIG